MLSLFALLSRYTVLAPREHDQLLKVRQQLISKFVVMNGIYTVNCVSICQDKTYLLKTYNQLRQILIKAEPNLAVWARLKIHSGQVTRSTQMSVFTRI